MNFSKFKKPMIIYFIFVILVLSSGISLVFLNNEFEFKIPLPNGIIFLFSIILIILTPIIGIFFGYKLGPLYLWIHKKVFGRGLDYYIQEKEIPEKGNLNYINLIYPALMVVNICIMLSKNATIQDILLSEAGKNDQMITIILMTILLPLGIIVATTLFIPAFSLDDAGIVYTNRKKAIKTRTTIEIRSVGNWYLLLLKGFAGISTLLSFYKLISDILIIMRSETMNPLNLIGTIFWPIMPFIIMIMLIPCAIILFVRYDKSNIFMKKWANKFEIKTILDEIVFHEKSLAFDDSVNLKDLHYPKL